jgi:hypothetical protein
MAQYYTLDEASKILGLTTDEFRKKLATQWKTIRRFPDGATLRFQSRDIDELARQAGRASESELVVGDAPLALAEESGARSPVRTPETVYIPESSDDFVPLSGESGSPSGKTKKSGSDSDIKLDSSSGGVRPVGHDDPTDVLEVRQKKSGIREKGSFEVKTEGPKSGGKRPPVTSEFELSLNTDSSDDFDLGLADDSDEVPIGTLSRKGPRSGDSGINLQDPADSGISLEKESSDFELKLEPEAAKPAGLKDDSSSEFELTLDDSGETDATSAFTPAAADDDQKDIFATDFELPAIDDSDSEVQSDSDSSVEDSDFDIDAEVTDSESESEVIAIDEEMDDLQPIEDDEPAVRPVAEVAAPPASTEWGTLPIVALVPTVLIMFFGGIMAYELLRNMWGYHHGGRVSGPIVRTIAGMFGDLADEKR